MLDPKLFLYPNLNLYGNLKNKKSMETGRFWVYVMSIRLMSTVLAESMNGSGLLPCHFLQILHAQIFSTGL